MFFPYSRSFRTIGFVRSIADGIVNVFGLEKVCFGEMVCFSKDVYGLVLNLESRRVSIIVLGKDKSILPGDVVFRTYNLMISL